MAWRISGVGLVTVSLRRSMVVLGVSVVRLAPGMMEGSVLNYSACSESDILNIIKPGRGFFTVYFALCTDEFCEDIIGDQASTRGKEYIAVRL